MRTRTGIVVCAMLLTGLAAMAAEDAPDAEPQIVKGYGDTEWGQSPEEVLAKVPGLEKIRKDPDRVVCMGTGEAPITSTRYQFFADRLCQVAITYKLPGAPEKGPDQMGLELISEMIAEKYEKDEETKIALQRKGIAIVALVGPEGTVMVIYENRALRMQIEREREEARQKRLKEEREKSGGAERRKQIKALGIEDKL